MDKNLYNTDYNLWLKETRAAILNRDFNHMDLDNLLIEIEDMGASQKRALRSYTKRTIEHLLKLKYWQWELENNRRHWQTEVSHFRSEIKDILNDSPSLRNYLEENYLSWFKSSCKTMAHQFEIPEQIMISLEDVLNDEFFG